MIKINTPWERSTGSSFTLELHVFFSLRFHISELHITYVKHTMRSNVPICRNQWCMGYDLTTALQRGSFKGATSYGMHAYTAKKMFSWT